jgi:protein-S-isoprenylcysteine O-methyltransferase Ste14
MNNFTLITSILGGALLLTGGGICIYWYIFWNRYYQGKLLTHGPYEYVRHPFYTGFILLAIGLGVLIPLYEARFLAIITLAVMSIFVPREEAELIRKYKEEYREYMDKVKWRLIPGVI